MTAPTDRQYCLNCRRALITCIILEIIWLAAWMYVGTRLLAPSMVEGWVWRSLAAIVWFLILVVIAVILMYATYLSFAHYHFRPTANTAEPTPSRPETVRTLPPLYYVCPACGKEFTQPGRCPIDFIPLKAVDPVEDRKFEEL